MTPPAGIVLLWVGFSATHIGLSSSPIRGRITARIGEPAFRALYSLVAFGFLVPLVWTFLAHKHGGTWLWILQRGAALRWMMYVGIGLAFVLLLASFVRPSPASLVPGDPTPQGVYHITRHPFSMALALFGLLHLPATAASRVDAAFCGGLIVFSVLACWHQDRRELALGVRGFREFYEATPAARPARARCWRGRNRGRNCTRRGR
jgi:uncharacterized membrane protein